MIFCFKFKTLNVTLNFTFEIYCTKLSPAKGYIKHENRIISSRLSKYDFSPMNPTAELCEFEEEKHLAIYFVEFIPALSIVCYFSLFVFILKPK